MPTFLTFGQNNLTLELNSKIAVIGGGSWATAIVKMLCENELKVGWYMRNSNAIEHIKKHHHNPRYIQAAEFNPKQLELSDDLNKIVAKYDTLIFAIPSAFLTSELSKLNESLSDKIVFSAIKGIVPETGLIIGSISIRNTVFHMIILE